VLTVESEKKRLILTCKKSLVTSKFPDVISYDQCEAGMAVQGFIATVQKNGLLVVFYNNIKVSEQTGSFISISPIETNISYFKGENCIL